MKQTILAIVVLALATPFLIWLALNPIIPPTMSLCAIVGAIITSVVAYTELEEK